MLGRVLRLPADECELKSVDAFFEESLRDQLVAGVAATEPEGCPCGDEPGGVGVGGRPVAAPGHQFVGRAGRFVGVGGVCHCGFPFVGYVVWIAAAAASSRRARSRACAALRPVTVPEFGVESLSSGGPASSSAPRALISTYPSMTSTATLPAQPGVWLPDITVAASPGNWRMFVIWVSFLAAPD